jgi:pyridoxamine 5'-phosphate oxidase
MRERLAQQTAAFANDASLLRPEHWGGFRLVIDAVEFWLEGADRFHERLRYDLGANRHWASGWLQP